MKFHFRTENLLFPNPEISGFPDRDQEESQCGMQIEEESFSLNTWPEIQRFADLGGVLDSLPVGVLVMSKEKRVLYVNSALEVITGFSRHEVLGKKSAQFLRPDFCTEGCPLRDLQGKEDRIVLEGTIINRHRKKLETRHTVSGLFTVEGNLVGYMETVEDIHLTHKQDNSQGVPSSVGGLLGNCPEMQKVFGLVAVVGQTDSSVLITGETGTGKDLLAEAVHENSPRAHGPFIKVNCGALPENLLESELFGHKKGAFTGAGEDKPGWFKMAHNGTLFLTEIGDLPLALQVKLLTFLDDMVIYPLGSTRGVKVNVRVMAATHRNLEEMVQKGHFRQDLMFRLNVMRLHLPPLRERGEDIRLLLYHFLNYFAGKMKKEVREFVPEALDLLCRYEYPGNVREIRNIVEYAIAVCQGNYIQIVHLPEYLRENMQTTGPPRQTQERADHSYADISPDKSWPEVEKEMILNALMQAGGKKSRAADILGWGRSTLWRKMNKYGLT